MNNPENKPGDLPPELNTEINMLRGMFTDLVGKDGDEPQPEIDANSERIIEALERASDQLEEEAQNPERYLFDQEEFVNALDHVVADQLAAIKNQQLPPEQRTKLTPAVFAERFNRWFAFCDGVVNMGFVCLYSQEAMKKEEYETVFRTLKLAKPFEVAYLKPRGIKVILSHKSPQVKEKYPWLGMPVLVVKDDAGVEHEIAITPSPCARVWWLDLLMSFHGSYEWITQGDQLQEERLEDEENFPQPTSIDNPLAPLEGLAQDTEEHKEEEQVEGVEDSPVDMHSVYQPWPVIMPEPAKIVTRKRWFAWRPVRIDATGKRAWMRHVNRVNVEGFGVYYEEIQK